MTCRIYLDEYYMAEQRKPGQRHEDIRIFERKLIVYLDKHYPGEWYFGQTKYHGDVSRCIYFEKDEVATMFMLKFDVQLKVVYERQSVSDPVL